MKKLNALIIGNGKIGQEVARQLELMEWGVTFYNVQQPSRLEKQMRSSAIVFLCISTKDRGTEAFRYIETAFRVGKPIVTAEKGSLAYHFDQLKDNLPYFGHRATVGGGSGILDLFSVPGAPAIGLVQGFINGSLNFISWGKAHGMDTRLLLEQAQKKGLLEQGVTSFSQVIKSELGDVMLKLAILFNISGICREHSITPDCFICPSLGDEEAERLFSDPRLRFMVDISPDDKSHCEGSPLIFADVYRWRITAGFFNQADYRGRAAPVWEENALFIEDHFGRSAEKSGIGAGPEPTVAVMIEDAKRLLALRS